MTESNSNNDSVRPRNRLGSTLAIAGGLLLATLLTANCWLVHRQLNAKTSVELSEQFWQLCGANTPAEQRVNSFLALIESGHSEWRSANLSHLELTGVDLSETELQNADFNNGTLDGCDFRKAKMYRTRFDLASAARASFREADLRETIFFQGQLHGTDYTSAILTNASLEQTIGEEGIYVLADLTEAYMLMAKLRGSNFSGANLTGANLEAADLSETNLALARFNGAHLLDVNLTNANWWRARGWTLEQIEELKIRFPPTEDARPELKRDYEKWLAKTTSKPVGPAPIGGDSE